MQHLALRLFPKISQNVGPATKSHTPPSPNIAPATQKMNLMIDPPHIWNVIDNALGTKSQPPTSPNTLRLSPKICDMLRLKSDTPTSPNAVLPRKVTIQHHQMLRLPRKLVWKMHSTLLYASILYASTLSTPLFSTHLFSTHLFLLIFKTS